MSTTPAPDTPAPAAPSEFNEEVLLMAEKIGELSDRFAKIESEFTAQTAPLDGAKAAQEAALTALSAALKGIEQLNFHVLQNNLGAVSTRIEKVDANWQAKARELGVTIKRVDDALVEVASQLRSELAAGNKSRVELGRNVATETGAVKTMLGEIGGRLAALQSDFAQRIEAARKEFATPTTLNPRGDWSPRETYDRLDVVTLNGTSYIAQRQTKEKPRADSADWQVLARRGALSAQAGGGVSDITGVAGMGATGLQIAQSGTPDEARGILGVNDFIGATAGTDGEAGRVPQPDAGEQGLFLRGDGTWAAAAVVTATLATTSEALAGTDNVKYISPLTGNARALLGDATRAVRPWVRSDGTTTNRAPGGIFVPGTRGALAAFPGPVTAWVRIPVPASNPAIDINPLAAQSDAGVSFGGSTSGLGIRINGTTSPAGQIEIVQWNSFTTNFRRIIRSGFVAAYAGRNVLLEISWPSGDTTTAPTVYVDGVDVTSDFTSSTGGTAPNWLPASSFAPTFHQAGRGWIAGTSPIGAFGFGAFTAAERAEIVQTGRFPAWWMRGGSAVQLVSNSDFSSFSGTIDDGNADTFTGWTIGANIKAEAITGGARFTAQGTYTSNNSGLSIVSQTISLKSGQRCLVTVRVRALGDSTSFLVWRPNDTAQGVTITSVLTTYSFQLNVGPNNTTTLAFGLSGTLAGVAGLEIEYLQVRVLGAITHPAPVRDTLMVADATELGNVPGRIVGGTVISEEAPCTVPLSLDYTYTGTSINLLGGVILPAGTIWEVVSVTGENNDSVNLSLGTSTGGTQIVNAQATTAAPFRIGTFASQLINATSATGLWLTFSGNCAGRINVQLRKIK